MNLISANYIKCWKSAKFFLFLNMADLIIINIELIKKDTANKISILNNSAMVPKASKIHILAPFYQFSTCTCIIQPCWGSWQKMLKWKHCQIDLNKAKHRITSMIFCIWFNFQQVDFRFLVKVVLYFWNSGNWPILVQCNLFKKKKYLNIFQFKWKNWNLQLIKLIICMIESFKIERVL